MPTLTSILLVDDDTTTTFLNKLLLTRMDVAEQVLIAENGEQALRLLDQICKAPADTACPRLILLDMNMPVLNGLGFLAAYTQMALAQQPPIVMLTTSLNHDDMLKAQ